MKRPVPILAALLALSACGGRRDEPEATIENAVVTLPAVPGRPGAAYFTLRSNRPDRLKGVSSPQIGRIELHESMDAGGMSRMARLEDPAILPGAPLIFEPGARHAMLYDIAPSVRTGQRMMLTFTFASAAPVIVEAEVRGPGEARRPE